MKRFLLVFLVLALAAGMAGCKKTPESEPPPEGPQGTLIVGCRYLGEWFIPGFARTSADQWVIDLLYGYSPYVRTADGLLVRNGTVVKDLETKLDESGNKTYTFTIHDDLKWSDGSGVSAADYVFSYLWQDHPLWQNAGARDSVGTGLVGYNDYLEGHRDHFQGVKLHSDYSFSVTIAKDRLSFWETENARIAPLPIKTWAPGCTIQQDEEGVKLAGEGLAEHFARVVAEEGCAPTVTSGPFVIESSDEEQVTLKVNQHFKGTYDGKTPQLEYVTIRQPAAGETRVDQCIAGEIDAVVGGADVDDALWKDEIDRALATGSIDDAYYVRSGFAGVFYHCDFGPTEDAKVRHALAFLIDRNEVMEGMVEGEGSLVDGYYSPSEWLYEDNKAAIDALTHFTLDIAEANRLLDETEWRFEADGSTPFDPEKAVAGGYFRHNPGGEVLAINHFAIEPGAVIADGVKYLYEKNAPKAGIDWQQTEGDFDALLKHYYFPLQLPPGERKYHSFDLNTNILPDFYLDFHSDLYGGYYNSCKVKDPELDVIMVKLLQVDPTKEEEYSRYWLEFQQRWQEILPIFPLYAEKYHYIYNKEIKGFLVTPFTTWAENVCDIHR